MSRIAAARRTAHVLNGALIVLSIGASLWVFPTLPDQIPRHFTLAGTADAYWAGTLLHWLFLPLVGAGIAALMYGLAWIVGADGQVVRRFHLSGGGERDRSQTEAERKAVQLYLYWTAAGMLVLFSALQWGVYRVATSPARTLSLFVLGTTAAIVVGVLAGAGALGWWSGSQGEGE